MTISRLRGKLGDPPGDPNRHPGRLSDRRGALTLPEAGGRLVFRLRHPKTTVRWRLTLLYGGLFLVCGAALLTVTYALVAHATVTRTPKGVIASGPPPRANFQVRSSQFPADSAAARPQTSAGLARGTSRRQVRGLRAADRRSAPTRDRISDRAGGDVHHLRPARLARGRTGAGPAAHDHRDHPADLTNCAHR